MSLEDLHLNLRNLTSDDYEQLKSLMDAVYHDIGGAWPKHTIDKLIQEFPDGQIAIEDDGVLVGVALTVQVDYDEFSNPHKYDDLIGHREIILNDPEGDAMYGLDVLIHPDYRGYRLGRRLYEARKELCRSLNLRAILAGGRIPEYHQHASELTPAQYIEKVSRKEIYDPILSFQLANDFQVKRLLRKYLPEDEQSRGYATLLEWNNILFEPAENVLDTRPTQVRVGAVQWQMREFASVGCAAANRVFRRCVVGLSERLCRFPGAVHHATDGPAGSRRAERPDRCHPLFGGLHRPFQERAVADGGVLQHQHRRWFDDRGG